MPGDEMNWWLWVAVCGGGLLGAVLTRRAAHAIRARRRLADSCYDASEDAAQQGIISFLVDLFLP
jgi:hypothetical protein